MTDIDLRARVTLWTDRVRAARAQQQAFLATATAYRETPTPHSDPWHGDYRRVLAAAELAKAEAAAHYLKQAEAVVADLLDRLTALEMNAEQQPPYAAPGVYCPEQGSSA